jgi:protein NRD1
MQIGWAVGFGPTSCADYKEGTSTIPINVLTDADCKWMLNAEYGGTGGKPIETGMIVEEPDIEIGAGPSSKGITSIQLLNDNAANIDHSYLSSRWRSGRLSWWRKLQSSPWL